MVWKILLDHFFPRESPRPFKGTHWLIGRHPGGPSANICDKTDLKKSQPRGTVPLIEQQHKLCFNIYIYIYNSVKRFSRNHKENPFSSIISKLLNGKNSSLQMA
jgi:hypothetical protein